MMEYHFIYITPLMINLPSIGLSAVFRGVMLENLALRYNVKETFGYLWRKSERAVISSGV